MTEFVLNLESGVSMNYYIGIDLGGTNIAVGVVDENYKIVGRAKRKTVVTDNPIRIIDDMAAAAQEAVLDAGLKLADIKRCGVGSPGFADTVNGILYCAFNLNIDKLNVKELMEERLNLPTLLANDANAAALGEMLAGAGKGSDNFVIITLGTGVGGGVIMNGKMLVGSNFAGGELGHSLLVYNGEKCACGRKGCWETYASATALIRQTKLKMQEYPDSIMWQLTGNNIDNVNGRTAFDAMREGDAAAKEVVSQYIEYVAAGVTNMINIFQPQILTIGGGISKEGDTLIKPVSEYVSKNAFSSGACEATKINVAQLGNDAGIIGAAFLHTLNY